MAGSLSVTPLAGVVSQLSKHLWKVVWFEVASCMETCCSLLCVPESRWRPCLRTCKHTLRLAALRRHTAHAHLAFSSAFHICGNPPRLSITRMPFFFFLTDLSNEHEPCWGSTVIWHFVRHFVRPDWWYIMLWVLFLKLFFRYPLFF